METIVDYGRWDQTWEPMTRRQIFICYLELFFGISTIDTFSLSGEIGGSRKFENSPEGYQQVPGG